MEWCVVALLVDQRLVVKFINLSMIQGLITHCLYIFCSVKICPHQFQNGVLFYCIHLMAGILLITIFPFLFYRVDDVLKIIKWILKPKLFAYLYVQIAYLPHVHVYISRFKYVNSSTPFKP